VVSYWYHLPMALTVRTDEQLEEALTALAEEEGTSRQEIIRRAVLERYERTGHRNRVEGSTRQMIERWGDVLERLGTE
jgi:predicted transcriptional regulator